LYKSFGLEGLKFYFFTNNFGRITGEYAGSSNDPFYYLYNILWIFIPWTMLVLVAVFFEFKHWFRKNGANSWGFYLLGSILAFLVILSVAKGKAPNYFLIALTPVSVIAAKWIGHLPELPLKEKNFILATQNVFMVLFGIYTLFVLFFFSGDRIWLSIFFAALLVPPVFILINIPSGKFQKMLLASVIVTGVLNLFLNARVIPEFFTYQGAKQALEVYEANRSENDALLNLHLEEYELFFYAESPVQNFTGWDNYYELFDTPGSWIYTTPAGYEGVMEHNSNVDTVYIIRHRGMNDLNLRFLNPKTRETTLDENYLIKVR
jgi:4-amino-4-deoxy-L-arabinose transferase-like glycosyltransferase